MSAALRQALDDLVLAPTPHVVSTSLRTTGHELANELTSLMVQGSELRRRARMLRRKAERTGDGELLLAATALEELGTDLQLAAERIEGSIELLRDAGRRLATVATSP